MWRSPSLPWTLSGDTSTMTSVLQSQFSPAICKLDQEGTKKEQPLKLMASATTCRPGTSSTWLFYAHPAGENSSLPDSTSHPQRSKSSPDTHPEKNTRQTLHRYFRNGNGKRRRQIPWH
jgi:hypothetical protein